MATRYRTVVIFGINRDMTDSRLLDITEEFATPCMLSVLRDAHDRPSGRAMVEFNFDPGDEAVGKTAVCLNNHLPCLLDKPILRGYDPCPLDCFVYVKGFSEDMSPTDFHIFLEGEFGKVNFVKILKDTSDRNLGYGIIQFAQPEFAAACLEKAKVNLNERNVRFERYIPSRRMMQRTAPECFKAVYVKDFPESVTDDGALYKMFERFGKIVNVKLALADDGTPKGFGFVNFERHRDASSAVNELHDKEIDGKKLCVTRAMAKLERRDMMEKTYAAMRRRINDEYMGRNLYIKRLPKSLESCGLKEMFEEFGQIRSAKVMANARGHSLGFGFVCFEEIQDAQKALQNMQGKVVGGKPLYISVAQAKEDRERILNTLHGKPKAKQPDPDPAPLPGQRNGRSRHPPHRHRTEMMPGMGNQHSPPCHVPNVMNGPQYGPPFPYSQGFVQPGPLPWGAVNPMNPGPSMGMPLHQPPFQNMSMNPMCTPPCPGMMPMMPWPGPPPGISNPQIAPPMWDPMLGMPGPHPPPPPPHPHPHPHAHPPPHFPGVHGPMHPAFHAELAGLIEQLFPLVRSGVGGDIRMASEVMKVLLEMSTPDIHTAITNSRFRRGVIQAAMENVRKKLRQ